MKRVFHSARLLLFAFIAAGVSYGVESISDPASYPIEIWHYGSGMNNQTVTFNYENGCSAFTIKIALEDEPGNELFSHAYGAPSTNPVSQNIPVPKPVGSGSLCVLSVMITHMMGNITTIKQKFNIENP